MLEADVQTPLLNATTFSTPQGGAKQLQQAGGADAQALNQAGHAEHGSGSPCLCFARFNPGTPRRVSLSWVTIMKLQVHFKEFFLSHFALVS